MQETENQSTLLYKFLDSETTDAEIEQSKQILVVEYYPSIDDYVLISEKIGKQYKLPLYTKYGLTAFFIVNAIGLPALLIMFDHAIPALAAFLLNMGFAIFILPTLVRQDYRRYYESYFPNLENEKIRIEASNNGLATSCHNDASFHAWRNFISIEEDENALYLYMVGGRGIAIRKNGFAYEETQREFVAFVSKFVGESKTETD